MGDIRVLGFVVSRGDRARNTGEHAWPPTHDPTHPVAGYRLGPGEGEEVVVIVGVTTDPGKAGHVQGLKVVYRSGRLRHTLTVPGALTTVCGALRAEDYNELDCPAPPPTD